MYIKKSLDSIDRHYNLLNDIIEKYGTTIVSRKQICEMIKTNPKRYPHFKSIINKPETYRVEGYAMFDLNAIRQIYPNRLLGKDNLENPLKLFEILFS